MLLLALSFLYYFNYTIWDIVIPGIFTWMAILAEKWSKANILLTYDILLPFGYGHTDLHSHSMLEKLDLDRPNYANYVLFRTWVS